MLEHEDVSDWAPCVCGKRANGDGRDFSVIGHGPRRYWCGEVACNSSASAKRDVEHEEIAKAINAYSDAGRLRRFELQRWLNSAAFAHYTARSRNPDPGIGHKNASCIGCGKQAVLVDDPDKGPWRCGACERIADCDFACPHGGWCDLKGTHRYHRIITCSCGEHPQHRGLGSHGKVVVFGGPAIAVNSCGARRMSPGERMVWAVAFERGVSEGTNPETEKLVRHAAVHARTVVERMRLVALGDVKSNLDARSRAMLEEMMEP